MSKLTCKYYAMLLEALSLEQAGYEHAKLYHTDMLHNMPAEDIITLADSLVTAISKVETGDTVIRAMGMARYYREFAAAKLTAA